MVLACAAGAWMLSCTREQVAEEVNHLQKELSFQVEVAPWQQTFPTKGVPYGEWDHVEDLSFGVSAYTSAPGGSEKRYFAPTKVAFDKQESLDETMHRVFLDFFKKYLLKCFAVVTNLFFVGLMSRRW